VVVPAHNEERYLRQCLRSVAIQNHRALECIVVDDASTDGTAKIVRHFAEADPRFRLVSHDVNKGLPAARNSGVAAARGELVAFLDADDYLYQNSLYDRVAALEGIDDQSVAGSYAGIHSVPEGGHWLDRLMPYVIYRRETITFLTRGGESPFPVHAPLIRRHVFDRLGGFDETMRDGCEDWDFWQRVLRAGYRFLPTHTVGGAYRMRPGSMRLEKAAKHSLVAAALIERAYRGVEGDAPGPFFHQPLGFYVGEAARIRRLIRGITLATVNGDEAGRLRCLAKLPAKAQWPLWVVDVSAEVAANLELHAAGNPLKLSEYRRRGAPIAGEIIKALN
jgi:glycosyltransferase involved in cell wall biosynthesis